MAAHGQPELLGRGLRQLHPLQLCLQLLLGLGCCITVLARRAELLLQLLQAAHKSFPLQRGISGVQGNLTIRALSQHLQAAAQGFRIRSTALFDQALLLGQQITAPPLGRGSLLHRLELPALQFGLELALRCCKRGGGLGSAGTIPRGEPQLHILTHLNGGRL